MGTKKLDTKTRQIQIAEKALEIILERGLAGLNMTQVASRCGLVPAGIYRHFEGKNQIVDAVFDFLRDRIFGFVEAIRQETPDAVERLRRLLTRHLKLLAEHQGIPQVVFSEGIFAPDGRGFMRSREIIGGYLERVEGIVREGQVAEQIRSDLDPTAVSLMFFGLILSTVTFSRVTSKEFDALDYVENAWPLFVTAITGHSRD